MLACDGRAVGVTAQLHQAWCQQLTAGLHSMGVRERVQSWGYSACLDALLSSQLEVRGTSMDDQPPLFPWCPGSVCWVGVGLTGLRTSGSYCLK